MKILMPALLAFFIFTAVSCSKEDSGQKTSGEIATGYARTLSSAPEKAEDAGDAAEKRDEKMEEAIKELDK